jgi:hypothetical protein
VVYFSEARESARSNCEVMGFIVRRLIDQFKEAWLIRNEVISHNKFMAVILIDQSVIINDRQIWGCFGKRLSLVWQ